MGWSYVRDRYSNFQDSLQCGFLFGQINGQTWARPNLGATCQNSDVTLRNAGSYVPKRKSLSKKRGKPVQSRKKPVPNTPSTRKTTYVLASYTPYDDAFAAASRRASSCSRRYAARISSTLASAFKGVGFSDASSSDREGSFGGIF